MKKILALLTIFFTAIANNLEPVQVDDMPYVYDGYYAGRTHTEVDYQELYSDYIDESNSQSDGCNISPRSAGNKTYVNSNTGRVWFIYESNLDAASKIEGFTDKKGTISLGAEDGETIVAPATCKIKSSANTSRNGTEMVITVSNYEIKITGMARWYCCAKRSPSLEEDVHATFTHTKDAKGVTLQKGDVLGYATKKTKVLIRTLKSDGTYKKVSLNDFYYGT